MYVCMYIYIYIYIGREMYIYIYIYIHTLCNNTYTILERPCRAGDGAGGGRPSDRRPVGSYLLYPHYYMYYNCCIRIMYYVL